MRTALFLACLWLIAPSVSADCDSSPLVITNVDVWSPVKTLKKRDVFFREGRVAGIASAGRNKWSDVRVIEGAGHTLLPGLIDLHTHLVLPGNVPKGVPFEKESDIAGRQLLRSGVTAGRLHLESLENAAMLKGRSRDVCEPLPRLEVGGPGLSAGNETESSEFWNVNGVADAKKKVGAIRERGMEWVAIHDADKFSAAALTATVKAARAAGLRIMAAGNRVAEIDAGMRIRPDTLDYIEDSSASDYPAATLESIRGAKNLVIVPHVGFYRRFAAYLAEPQQIEREENFEFMPPEIRAHAIAQARAELERRRVPVVMAVVKRKFDQLRGLGHPVALGTDTGSRLHFQSTAIWWELEAWREYGASPKEALSAATAAARHVLRMPGVGRLAVGDNADFVLYRGNAEEGGFNRDRVVAVGKGGVLFLKDGKWVGP